MDVINQAFDGWYAGLIESTAFKKMARYIAKKAFIAGANWQRDRMEGED